MKTLFLLAVVFLSGCANFDAEKFNQAFAESMRQQQLLQDMRVMQMNNMIQAQQSESKAPNVGFGVLEKTIDNGFVRYCQYSNGVITTISSVKLCSISIR